MRSTFNPAGRRASKPFHDAVEAINSNPVAKFLGRSRNKVPRAADIQHAYFFKSQGECSGKDKIEQWTQTCQKKMLRCLVDK
jgi:hypothetical protein